MGFLQCKAFFFSWGELNFPRGPKDANIFIIANFKHGGGLQTNLRYNPYDESIRQIFGFE